MSNLFATDDSVSTDAFVRSIQAVADYQDRSRPAPQTPLLRPPYDWSRAEREAFWRHVDLGGLSREAARQRVIEERQSNRAAAAKAEVAPSMDWSREERSTFRRLINPGGMTPVAARRYINAIRGAR